MAALTIEKLQAERLRLVEQRETAVRQVAALDGAVAFCDYSIKLITDPETVEVIPDAAGPSTDSVGHQTQSTPTT